MIDAEDEDDAQPSSALVVAALTWLGSLRQQGLPAVWTGLSPDYRLALAQAWLVSNPAVLDNPLAFGGREKLAADLATDPPVHPLWSGLAGFAHQQLMRLTAWTFSLELAPDTHSRLVAPGLESLRLCVADDLAMDKVDRGAAASRQAARALTMILEHDGGAWRIAGIGGGVLNPGWPPHHQQLVGAED